MNKVRVSKDVRATESGTLMSVEDIASLIRSDDAIKATTEQYSNGCISKTAFPVAEFHSVCSGVGKNENISSFTGYAVFDIDEDIDKMGGYDAVRQQLIEDDVLNPVLVFRSPSGNIKAVVRVPSMESITVDGDYVAKYKEQYRQLATYYSLNYCYRSNTENKVCYPMLDESGNDSARKTFLSHDADCYCNPQGVCTLDIHTEMDDDDWDKYKECHGGVGRDALVDIGEMDTSEHSRIAGEIIAKLMKDDNGEYIYTERVPMVTIGSRSAGNAVDYFGLGDNYMGYNLKLKINAVCMLLFGGDVQKANLFILNNFVTSDGGTWNLCTDAHATHKFSLKVLCWVIKTFKFKLSEPIASGTTTMTFEHANGENAKGTPFDDCCVSKHLCECYDEIKSKYGLPSFFDAFIGSEAMDSNTRDLQFYSSLVTISGFATNNYVQYNGKKNALNLYMSVVGKAASGKGAMAFPKKILLSNLDRWYTTLNEMEADRYKSEKKQADGGDEYVRVDKPMNFQTTIERPTAAYIINTLYDNNNKCMFFNNEMGSVADADNGNYGGFNSMLRNIYDNDDISNETNNNKREGYASRVYDAAMCMLISGTPAQAKKMFIDIENGLVSRFLTFYVGEQEYQFPLLHRQRTNYDDVELMFLQWHIENMVGMTKTYEIGEIDYDYVADKYTDNIPKLCSLYNDGSIVGDAIKATLMRFPMYVFRVASLIQSIDEFERTHSRRRGLTAVSYLQQCDANRYISTQRGLNSHYIDNENPFALGDQIVPLDRKWVECADLLLRPLLTNHINFLQSYGSIQDDNTIVPRKLIVLDKMDEEFSFTEFWKVYNEMYQPRTENAAKTYSKRALKQLVVEGDVLKIENGYRKLLK